MFGLSQLSYGGQCWRNRIFRSISLSHTHTLSPSGYCESSWLSRQGISQCKFPILFILFRAFHRGMSLRNANAINLRLCWVLDKQPFRHTVSFHLNVTWPQLRQFTCVGKQTPSNLIGFSFDVFLRSPFVEMLLWSPFWKAILSFACTQNAYHSDVITQIDSIIIINFRLQNSWARQNNHPRIRSYFQMHKYHLFPFNKLRNNDATTHNIDDGRIINNREMCLHRLIHL